MEQQSILQLYTVILNYFIELSFEMIYTVVLNKKKALKKNLQS